MSLGLNSFSSISMMYPTLTPLMDSSFVMILRVSSESLEIVEIRPSRRTVTFLLNIVLI